MLINFIAMTMFFYVSFFPCISVLECAALFSLALIFPQSHCASHRGSVCANLLFAILVNKVFNQINNRLFCFRIKFHRICFFDSQNIMRKLQDCQLHSKTDSKEWNLIFSLKPNGFHFALNPSFSKSTGHQNTINIL